MEIILKHDVENLGFVDDIVEVKNGYGRNFLIPQGKAILATSSAKKMLAETMRQRAKKNAKLVSDAEGVGKLLADVTIKIIAKSADGVKLFGSVNNVNVSEELKKQGHDIEPNYISIEGRNIKRVGEYVAQLRLHRDVIFSLPFSIEADPNSIVKKKKVKEETFVKQETDSMFGKKESIDEVIGQISKKSDVDEFGDPLKEVETTEEVVAETKEAEAAESTEKTEE